MADLSTITVRIKLIGAWLRSCYSEPDGTGSSTRIHISLLIAFVLSVGASFAHLVNLHVISIEQFCIFLGAAATFLVTTTGPLYGANKLADWAKGKHDDNISTQ